MDAVLQRLVDRAEAEHRLSPEETAHVLASGPDPAAYLYRRADALRARTCGDEIYLRGIIEFSNHCRNRCGYCGIGAHSQPLSRYRIPDDEILDVCRHIETAGMTTVVLQSGEDPYYSADRLGQLVGRIKEETALAVTLSVGEREEADYRRWRDRGMDRYLLRFETASPRLYREAHPGQDFEQRIACLQSLRRLGVQTGSGLLIGLPGQTIHELAADVLFCTDLDLDMIGCGPFIPHEQTPFAATHNPFPPHVFYNVIALLRLFNPAAHIPATTAFDALTPDGRNLLLQRGANVFMPNATPQAYRGDYLLYPNKPCVDESADDCAACVRHRIHSLGRSMGQGPGHSLKRPAHTLS